MINTVETTETDTRAKDNAQAGVDSIRLMVERLEHCRDCKGDAEGDDCELGRDDVLAGVNIYPNQEISPDGFARYLAEYHDEDKAQQAIDESHYGIQVRGGWHSPGDSDDLEPYEFTITLSGGGPASRIYGELGQHNEPENVEMQYQDWFTPWTRLSISSTEQDALEAYARCFYFGD